MERDDARGIFGLFLLHSQAASLMGFKTYFTVEALINGQHEYKVLSPVSVNLTSTSIIII